MGVPSYFVYGPEAVLIQSQPLIVYQFVAGEYLPRPDYQLSRLGLSLRLWDGVSENWQGVWLRWATLEENLLPTSAELSDRERTRA